MLVKLYLKIILFVFVGTWGVMSIVSWIFSFWFLSNFIEILIGKFKDKVFEDIVVVKVGVTVVIFKD